jgi:hypothetical protein
MTIWNIAAALTGERLLMKDTSGRRASRDEVARLAYRLYETHGRRDGYDLDDWLAAERLLSQRRSS